MNKSFPQLSVVSYQVMSQSRSPSPNHASDSRAFAAATDTEATEASTFPPAPSTTGKKYYAFAPHHCIGAVVVCGHKLALEYLSGSWFRLGKAPKGFKDLEAAVSEVGRLHKTQKVEVRWQ